MEPKLVHYDGGGAIGLAVRTRNQDELDPAHARIPGLWSRFFGEELTARVPGARQPRMAVGAYYDYQSDHNGEYSLLAGVLTDPAVPAPPGLSKVVIPTGEYLVFRAEGAMPGALVETWRRVWDYFALPGGEARKYSVDFELYRSDTVVDVHIAIT
jgi:predicted transcriptional regulator YdeE